MITGRLSFSARVLTELDPGDLLGCVGEMIRRTSSQVTEWKVKSSRAGGNGVGSDRGSSWQMSFASAS